MIFFIIIFIIMITTMIIIIIIRIIRVITVLNTDILNFKWDGNKNSHLHRENPGICHLVFCGVGEAWCPGGGLGHFSSPGLPRGKGTQPDIWHLEAPGGCWLWEDLTEKSEIDLTCFFSFFFKHSDSFEHHPSSHHLLMTFEFLNQIIKNFTIIINLFCCILRCPGLTCAKLDCWSPCQGAQKASKSQSVVDASGPMACLKKGWKKNHQDDISYIPR